MHTHTHI